MKTLSTHEVELERIKIGLVEKLSYTALHDLSVSVNDDFFTNLVSVQIKGYIWGERGKSETIKYPKNWREAFKERWFPAWLLRRYPVVYRVHEINTTTLYPNFKISVPDQTHVLKFQTLARDVAADVFPV
jgi:hypothetical protein